MKLHASIISKKDPVGVAPDRANKDFLEHAFNTSAARWPQP
jgi:hypothetical protein